MKKLKVAELFAGVGGFRLGLEKTKSFEVIWSNQWEPSTKKQHASLIYEDRFKTNKKTHSSEDIFEVDNISGLLILLILNIRHFILTFPNSIIPIGLFELMIIQLLSYHLF